MENNLEVMHFYAIRYQDGNQNDWERLDNVCKTLEEAQRAISTMINCQYNDVFRYEISGNELSKDVYDCEKHEWAAHFRIDLYRATLVK